MTTKQDDLDAARRERCTCGEVRGSHSTIPPHACFGCACPAFKEAGLFQQTVGEQGPMTAPWGEEEAR